jgi:hypothetical protein
MPIINLENKICIDSRLIRFPCLRIWYLFRSLDKVGRGFVAVSFSQIRSLLRCASSTLYQWLREGREIGAIRAYKRRGDSLGLWLGSRSAICRNLGLLDWGASQEIELREIINLSDARAQASLATVAKQQKASQHAALHRLSPDEKRKVKKLPSPEAIFKAQGQRLSITGQWATSIPYVLKITSRKVFVSKGFIPFGCSQKSVANLLGISDRTLRRHLDLKQVDRRQILQSKSGYANLYRNCLRTPRGGGGIFQEDFLWYDRKGNTTYIDKLSVSKERFFEWSGAIWLSRNNLYDLSIELIPQKQARITYKSSLSKGAKPPRDKGD